MPEFIRELTRSLRFKLLAAIFVLLALSISVTLIGFRFFEQQRHIEQARAGAEKNARIIQQTLRRAMLENNWEQVDQTLHDLQLIISPVTVSILAADGRVLSGDSEPAGRWPAVATDHGVNPEISGHAVSQDAMLRDRLQAAECAACHRESGDLPRQNAIFLETDQGPLLRQVIKLVNAPDCRVCHDPARQTLGMLVHDTPFDQVFAKQRTVMVRMFFTGLATFVLTGLLLSLLVTRYFHRPLRQLETGFEQVARGNFDHWVEIDEEGEIQDMAVQFNVMTRAIQRSFNEIKRKQWETGHLYAFVRHLSRETEWQRLRQVILDLLLDAFQARQAALFLNREGRESSGRPVMRLEVAWHCRQNALQSNRYRHREFDNLEQAGAELPSWLAAAGRHWREQPTAGIITGDDNTMLITLTAHQAPLGMLCLQRPPEKPFDEMERKLLAALREQIEISLSNARLYRMAITDALTGLYGKRYCETMLRKFIEARTNDPGRTFGVLMLDLDHFKRVNDTYGHPVGDEVLVQLADLIRHQIRQDDIACRYGGEEFIVLVNGDAATTMMIAERICTAVGEHVFRCADGLALRNTVSIGAAAFPAAGNTAVAVVAAADQALYQAKDQGRNRVIASP